MLTELLLPVLLVCLTLVLGPYLLAVIDGAIAAAVGRRATGSLWLAPLHRGAWLWLQPRNHTERPDSLNWQLAPAAYLALAAAGLAVVPWSATLIPTDISTGLVLWGSVEALATVVIFLHGWSANALLPLIGAYRYVALGLSYILISMFVLIGVALPAESLQVSAVVESQQTLWNVIRQPLGLPLFLIVGLGVSFWGPLNFADSTDLAGGTASEISGPSRLVWQWARAAMLVAFSAMAATAFLGGWLGPWLPGPLWLILKSLALMALLLWLGHALARVSPERFVTLAWVLFLPLSFADLVWAGLEAMR
ncbi:NADH-quinone oxidoreductase subunit H [Pseudomonas sp. NPDC047963]|jgi:NADH-quinone oxidoreductase subunit H|uniref:NADH-quinone oxidoreductase subunit H n=1 Tax=Stutzerimonas zhaodongensis TaxID=1176257 RepID=UPI001F4EA3E9|nr:NADH-quinone oxidoreductase subunit H [Stutzerimonas zhaodongensis]MCH2342765.1 NADH-quinone oxidoreductase subunit H [Pseudomonas sp.]UNG19389.1 NADH-quinone oxidoreductase subunit H [Stutzerimonas zhaodongensis]|tara:strand:+ start:3916 stop:4839 length:924 start_codon:yes stop_codon:yes gene_type:complete